MGRQMFAKGGAAFPDLSGDGKVTQKDILMGRGVVPMAEGGEVPGDVRAIFQGLVESMRGSKEDVAAYVRGNTQDLSDIAKMYPNMAAMINEGFKVTSEVPMQEYFPPEYGQGPESFAPMQPPMQPSQPSEQEMNNFFDSLRRSEELGRPDDPAPVAPVAPPEGVYMQMGGEPMAAAMEQGAMPAEPMAAMGAPSPADLGSMDTAGIASQMDPEVVAIMQGAANNFGDPEQAESLEGMMDAVRGTRATEEERREELAGVVGPEDAAATPDSVLAMVQPLMLLMGAQGAMETEVDTGGIGPMAQDTMNVPVSGDMAGGIMQMAAAPPPPPEGGVPPVNFSQGGEVLRFSEAGAVPDLSKIYDVNPAAIGPVQNRFPINPSLDTLRAAGNIDRMARSPAPAPAAKSSSVPDFGPTAAARLQQYKALMGDTGAEEDKDLAQAQFFQDLAKFGFSLMQAPKVGENPLAQAGRAALETGLGQNTLNLMAKQKAAQRAADRGLKLASITATEAELTAAQKSEAALAAAKTKARAQASSDFKKAKVSVEKDVRRLDHVTDDGTTVSIVQRSTLTPDYQIIQQPFVAETMANGEPVVTAKPNEDIRKFVDVATGNTILQKSVGGGPYTPILGPNKQPLPTKLAQVKWDSQVQPDGKTVVQRVNAITLEPIKGRENKITLPAEIEIITVPGFTGQVFGKNKVTGEVTPITNLQGRRDNDVLVVNNNVLTLDPETKEIKKTVPIAGAPVLRADGRGRLGYVSAPTERNPNGVFTPIDGAQIKGSKYTYQTWINPQNNQTRVVYQVDGGKKLFDAQTGLEAPLTSFVRVSDDTAFASSKAVEQGRRRDQAYRETLRASLREMVDQDPEAYVDRVYGPELSRLSGDARDQARARRLAQVRDINASAEQIARDTGRTVAEVIISPVSLREQLDKGTGLWPRVRAAMSGAGAAIFNVEFWKDNRDARQFVRQLSHDLKIAAANSPRFAEGEQIRLGQVTANVDTWLTSGRIEENKLRVLKRAMASELQTVRLRLAGGTEGRRLPDLSKTVRSQLELVDINLTNGLRMLSQIPMYTDTSRLRNAPEAEGAGSDIERALQQGGPDQ
jgi:hypothetical protein